MNNANPRLLVRSAWPPRQVIGMATLFFLVCLTLQCWRLVSLSATYDQALFLQELWSTAQGRPFESSLSSVLSGAVAVGDALPSVSYLHLGQHANALTLIGAPLVAWLGPWALPLLQVSALTAGGLVFWQLAASRLPAALAERLTAAYFLSGAVIGPALENFHDLIWLPLLGFLVVGGGCSNGASGRSCCSVSCCCWCGKTAACCCSPWVCGLSCANRAVAGWAVC